MQCPQILNECENQLVHAIPCHPRYLAPQQVPSRNVTPARGQEFVVLDLSELLPHRRSSKGVVLEVDWKLVISYSQHRVDDTDSQECSLKFHLIFSAILKHDPGILNCDIASSDVT